MADALLDPVVLAQWGRDLGIAGLMQARWGWPVTEVFHFVGLCLLFGTVGFFDLRMLGVARGVSLMALHRMIPLGLAGFALSLTTGLLFFFTAPDQYLYNPAFQTKAVFIGLAGLNMLLFYAIAARDVQATPAGALPPLRARVFGAVSLTCWLGVIVCGRVITAFRPPWHWCFWC